MAQALGFIFGGATFLPLAIPVERPAPATGGSTVQITVGSGPNSQAGGNVPHIALWDDDGNRIGQYHPRKTDKIAEGDSGGGPINVPNNQNGGRPADPYYVMLSNLQNDAICISAVSVANNQVSATFFGDTGYQCGQSWFLSEHRIGADFAKPKCVWLDGDHSNGINARALSFHLNDMAAASDKLAEYTSNPDTLCKSTPRFSFWGNLLPDSQIPFFDPKLEYDVVATDEEGRGSGEGGDKNPQRVIDKPGQYDKSVYLFQGEKHNTKRETRRRRNIKVRGSNQDPEHLIITDHQEDDIREVCESSSSHGFDIVSTVQKLYCDMEEKQLYQICDEEHVKDNCFDMETKSIKPKDGIGARAEFAAAVPQKNYTSQAYWKN
ncbi:uncharacterized protein MYCGRDRAFT_92790 [Zymoseptoria tritici IPO323]|uniref:Uncharacterized protein n=1 Tax=Zymoseptoria tritici (strain CBS 115943 / IPO323) TaxID=336722 RepID=F9XAB9_ZYMTI|nr:uncharacterized protein MYCGRDRAFT_92790 [Zymoseptoria tritici IPO323]EGP88255.1 hypothetical protein MYCGRDRAFT_92790 [Zymoseptoria tritici IPO323]